MKAYTKPREVDYFLYKGRTKEFEEWCESIGVDIENVGEDVRISYERPSKEYGGGLDTCSHKIPSRYAEEGCVIVVGTGICRMPADHFYKHYDLPQPVSSEYFEPDYSDNEMGEFHQRLIDNGEI